MSAIKPIIREVKQAVLKGMAHSKDRLHQVTDNLNVHLDNVGMQIKNIDKYDGAPTRVDVNVKSFTRNKKHDAVEFDRQYNEQIDTLQQMSMADWKQNRESYLENGRTSDSLRAQQNARDAAFNDKYDELRDEGLSPEAAEAAAAQWLKGQAATHRLDGIAGGNVTDISGVGDSRINSSLGSQWRSRVGDIDSAVSAFIAANPGVDLSSVYMNIVFR